MTDLTKHAFQTTPSLEWVMEKMAVKTAKQTTPHGAWLALRAPFMAAIDKASALPELDWTTGETASYEAAYAVVKAAKAALREFDRKNPKPHTAKVWKDVGRDDPLLQVIFGDRK